MSLGARISASARSWLGTRFHHQGRLKKSNLHSGGVDCLGLLIGVASELNLKARNGSELKIYDCINYSHYPDTAALFHTLSKLMHKVELCDLREGDVLLLNVDQHPQHLAIVTQNNVGVLHMIHAYAPARKVVEHVLDAYWMRHIVAIFRI